MKILIVKSVDHLSLTEFCQELFLAKIPYETVDLTLKVGFFRHFLMLINYFKFLFFWVFSSRSYSIVLIQYVSTYSALLLPLFFLFRKKIVLRFWGSDIFQIKKITIFFLKLFGDKIDIIVANPELKLILENLLKRYDIKIIRFGLGNINQIDYFNQKNKNEQNFILGKCLGQELLDSTLIVCGTNASENQQHLKIIEVLNDACKNGVLNKNGKIFIFLLGYGGSFSYRKLIKDALEKSIFNYYISESFFTGSELAAIRVIPHCLIQVQKYDAASAAMQEVLYAQRWVITGDWLPYQDMLDAGVVMDRISELKEIPEKITMLEKSNIFNDRSLLSKNAEIIYNFSSWSFVMKDWKDALSK